MTRLRPFLLALFCLLYVGTWPGSAVRPLLVELTASPVPKDVVDRDGVLDVVVHAKDDPKQPLAAVRVRAFAILDGRAHDAGEATSDTNGRATLRDLPRAEHWIVAEAKGFARASQMVVIVPGARRLDLELGKEHTLDVLVQNEAGAPIGGAEIEARGIDPFPVGGRTADDGSAHVGRLGEAPWTVTVRAPGFEEVTRRRVAEGERLVVKLGKQGTLVVRVEGPDGAPQVGARVLLSSPQLWPARVADTGADGSVRIGSLDPGTYTVRSVHNTLVSPIEIGVALAKGEEKTIELRLAPGVMITAHVVEAANDDDVPKARVTLAEAGLSPFPIEGITDKHGKVVLGPIAHGAASLAARADGFVGKGAVRVEDPAPPEVKIALVRGGTLLGKVTDTRGWPVDGATIRVVGTDLEGMPIDEDPQRISFREAHFTAALAGPTPLIPAGELGVMPGPVPPIPHGANAIPGGVALAPGGALVAQSKDSVVEPWISGRDGAFEAKPIPPGRVRVLVTHPQYVEAMSELVTLVEGKDAKVDVVLSRGGTVEGRVVDSRGRPVAAQVTMLATRGSLERTTKTGTDGSFAFASAPEALTLLVSRDEDVTQVSARVEVLVPEGGKKALEITLPDPRQMLPVKVTGDSRRDPVENAQVTASSLDANEALRATVFTDKNGEAYIPAGKGIALRVEIRASGRAPRVMVTTPESTVLEVALAAAESVIGEVRAGRRDYLEGAEVTLQTETGTRHARTNKDGEFTIRDASPGPARLRVRAKGRAPLVKDVVVEERSGRRPTDLGRLELAEEAIVDGTVVDQKGDPIAGARVARDAVPTYLTVGATPSGMAVCDGRGHFQLGELPEGNIVLEAYAPDVGRVRQTVRLLAGRTTDGVKLVITRGEAASNEPLATGGVAITLGETAAGLEAAEIVVVSVAEGSEAEHAGILAGDILSEVGGVHPRSIAEARAKLSGPVHDDVVLKVRRGERTIALRVAREAVRR